MRILIAYDGSHSADAALDDLQRAGLPHDAEALILSVASGPDPKHFTEAYNLAEQAAEKVRACFPNWAGGMLSQRGGSTKNGPHCGPFSQKALSKQPS